ncbi:hypothetical protein TruAng_010564 [Truncatella angustata]|nr:hypothetical protein TruAng_010564 [Truncatella angustata]
MTSTITTEKNAPRSPIKVIIVGAGFGGLTAAVECHRLGLDVEIYEAFAELKVGLEDAPVLNGHRGELHEIVFKYVRDELRIPIHLGKRITQYFENKDEAGIELETKEKVGLIHAQRSGLLTCWQDFLRLCYWGRWCPLKKARELVIGYEDKPKSSGYAIWRAWFPSIELARDHRTAQFCVDGDTFNGWIGPDVHFLFSTLKGGEYCSWVLTHKDTYDIEESWSLPGRVEDVLEVLADWDPVCRAIVEKTPSVVDWKLVYREPLPHWVSDGGRIALIGDAAHPFLPTSIQGASQAMEDGVIIAVCLEKAGKDRVKQSIRAYQDIRYERVKEVQKTGVNTGTVA